MPVNLRVFGMKWGFLAKKCGILPAACGITHNIKTGNKIEGAF
jgi:hypothetical protein